MSRFSPVLRILVFSLVLFIGFASVQPSTPAASAYPTALQNFSAPTAYSEGCQFPGYCYKSGMHSYCDVGTDPEIGCVATTGLGCHFCLL